MKKEKPVRSKQEVFVVQIGPLLKRVLDEQMESIREVTYGTAKNSYYVSGEIVAKKVLGLI